MRRPSRPRKPASLSQSVHQQLNSYALAASAAGVSLLALAQPSEAKIIYTKTHQVIGNNGIYGLDLNRDGTMDFLIRQSGYPISGSGNNVLEAKEALGNAVEGSHGLAAALRKGRSIGARQQFITGTSYAGEVMVGVGCFSSCSTTGRWANVNNRYLGLRFQIGGKTHYGWARLSVELLQDHKIIARLTGYAYETIENKGIRAGQTRGQADGATANSDSEIPDRAVADAVPSLDTVQPASLGRLAFGARKAFPLGGGHEDNQPASSPQIPPTASP